jgi:cation diffusion facilitator family transporter
VHLVTAPELAEDEALRAVVTRHDEDADRRGARRAVTVSAAGLAVTGTVELLLALLSGSVGLLGDALHNLADVSTSAVVLAGFRWSRRAPSASHPYGYEKAEDLAGLVVAAVVWASAVLAGYESWQKLVDHAPTTHVGWAMVGAVVGIVGNQVVARAKLAVGRRIQSATLIAEARHSWLDALSSVGALGGLVAVALGYRIGDPIAGFAVTAFICHVGFEVTGQLVQHLMDGVDPEIVVTAETAANQVPGVAHAHVCARWAGRTLILDVEGWVAPSMPVAEATALGTAVAQAIVDALPAARRITWRTRPAPALGLAGGPPDRRLAPGSA